GLQNLILRLLLNLSHDENIRTELMRMGFLDKLMDLLHNKNHILLALQLLYMLSVDDKSKAYFAFGDTLPMITKMILEYKGERVNVELMSLSINIAAHPKNAEILCENQGLKFLMKRAIKTRDPLILKMIRNIALLDKPQIKMMFLDFIDDLMRLLFKFHSNPDISVEVIGILSTLTIPDFDFTKLAAAYNLLEFISKKISSACSAATKSTQNGSNEQRGGICEEDDVTLELVCLIGTMANDENIPPMMVKANIIPSLMELMI
ncbi:Kinesin-associated protein 3, partial [Nowakowskiella sp. JEL0078]